MNFDGNKNNNNQNSSYSDDSPLDFFSQSEIIKTRQAELPDIPEENNIEDVLNDFNSQKDQKENQVLNPFPEKEDVNLDKPEQEKVFEARGNEEFVAKPADVALENLDEIIRLREQGSLPSNRQERIEEIKRGIEEIAKVDELNIKNQVQTKKPGIGKFLLISGPIFLVICLAISFFIINNKLGNSLNLLEIFSVEK